MNRSRQKTSELELAQLFANAPRVKMPAEVDLFHEHDTAQNAMFVVDGVAERYVTDPERGLEARTWTIEANSFLGLEEVLTLEPRLTSARAVTPVEMIVLSTIVIEHRFQTSADFRALAVKSLAASLSNSVEWGREMAFSTVEQRLARFLSNLLSREPSSVSALNVPTLDRMAAQIGTAPRSVRRVLTRWRRSGILERRGADFVVFDHQVLLDLAGT